MQGSYTMTTSTSRALQGFLKTHNYNGRLKNHEVMNRHGNSAETVQIILKPDCFGNSMGNNNIKKKL